MKRSKKAEIEKVFPKDKAAEEIAQNIENIAKSFKALNASRLKRDTIVALIHDRSKIGKSTINVVLNNLELMEDFWLKKVNEK